MSKRCFIAINLPDDVKDILESLQDKFQAQITNSEIKWSERSNFHITLKFLGNVPDENIVDVEQIMQGLLSHQRNFRLKLKDIVLLPSPDLPRIISIGIENNEILNYLVSEVSHRLEQTGLPLVMDQKDFTPHITIGKNNGEAVKLKVEDVPLDNEFGVRNIELMESKLSSSGPEYFVLKRFDLK